MTETNDRPKTAAELETTGISDNTTNPSAKSEKTICLKPGSLWQAVAMVIGGGICISFSGIFMKASGVSSENALFYRCLFGGLSLGILSFFTKESYRASAKTYSVLAIVAVCFTLDLIFWHNSITYVGPGMATILANFHVFFIALISFVVFREKLSTGLLIGLPIAFGGLWLIMGVTPTTISSDLLNGTIQGLTASWWYALYVLVLRQSQKISGRISPIASITVISLACAVLGFIICVVQGESLAIPTSFAAIMLLTYGVTGQALGGLLFTYGLPRLPVSLGGPLMLVQPALAFIWDIVFFNRPTSILMVLGAVITISAIYLAVNGQIRLEKRGQTNSVSEKKSPCD